MDHFLELERKNIALTVAGNIRTAKNVNDILEKGVDFVSIGRAAILHHDFPIKVMQDDYFQPIKTPVSKDYLMKEGLGEKFINYMKKWPDFVTD